jgi:hypothetical protein
VQAASKNFKWGDNHLQPGNKEANEKFCNKYGSR